MRDLASDLKSEPKKNTELLKMSGIAVIALGLIIGGLLFYATSLIWPGFLEHVEDL